MSVLHYFSSASMDQDTSQSAVVRSDTEAFLVIVVIGLPVLGYFGSALPKCNAEVTV